MSELSIEAKQAAGDICITCITGNADVNVKKASLLIQQAIDAATANLREENERLRQLGNMLAGKAATSTEELKRYREQLQLDIAEVRRKFWEGEAAKLRKENERLYKLLDQANHTLLEAGLKALSLEQPKE